MDRRSRSHASDSTFVLNIRIHIARRTSMKRFASDATRHRDIKNHDIVEIAWQNPFGEREEFLSERFDVAVRPSADAALERYVYGRFSRRGATGRSLSSTGQIDRDARKSVLWSDGPQIVSPSLHKAQWSRFGTCEPK